MLRGKMKGWSVGFSMILQLLKTRERQQCEVQET